jgi:hypothetical protein
MFKGVTHHRGDQPRKRSWSIGERPLQGGIGATDKTEHKGNIYAGRPRRVPSATVDSPEKVKT